MKLRPRRYRSTDATGENGVLPLINVVFILLVFFLLAGRIAMPEAHDIAPPTSSLAPDTPADPAAIEVTANGDIRYAGAIGDLAAIAHAIAAHAADTPATIRAHRDAPAGRVVEAAAALRRAGVNHSTLVVQAGR